MNQDLTPKQQTSEALRQAETILITSGKNPSIDQVTAVLGLAMVLRKFGKKVTAIISDNLPSSLQFLPAGQLDRSLTGMRDFVLNVDLSKAEVDKLKYTIENGKLNIHITPFKGGFAPSDVTFGYGGFHYDVAVVLGVPTRARIDRVFDQNPGLFDSLPIVNIDFHRSNENYGAINLIEPTASSLAEILVALSESLESGLIDEPIATSLLAGIMASTDRFTATHTTAKSLTVAAQLMAAGGQQQMVVKNLYQSNKGGRGEKPQGQSQPQPAPTSQPAQQPVQPTAVEAPAHIEQMVEQPLPPIEPTDAGGSFDQVAESFNAAPAAESHFDPSGFGAPRIDG